MTEQQLNTLIAKYRSIHHPAPEAEARNDLAAKPAELSDKEWFESVVTGRNQCSRNGSSEDRPLERFPKRWEKRKGPLRFKAARRQGATSVRRLFS
jgi:hypothetical protein